MPKSCGNIEKLGGGGQSTQSAENVKIQNHRDSRVTVYIIAFIALLLCLCINHAQAQIQRGSTPDIGDTFGQDELDALDRIIDYYNDILGDSAPNIIINYDKSLGETKVDSHNGTWETFASADPGRVAVIQGGGKDVDWNGSIIATQVTPGTSVTGYAGQVFERTLVHNIGQILRTYPETITGTWLHPVIDKDADSLKIADNIVENSWGSFLYFGDNKVVDNYNGDTFTNVKNGENNTANWENSRTDEEGQFTFRGPETLKVLNDGKENQTAYVTLNYTTSGTSGYLETLDMPFSVWNPTYNEWTRVFLTELELAMLKDIGYDSIDLKKFFGQSVYTDNNTLIISDEKETVTGRFSVGLHVASSNNTITLDTNLTSEGQGGAGIRIEQANNNVTISEEKTVNASGQDGIGVVVIRGVGESGTNSTLVNNGTILAQGTNGTGVYIDTRTVSFTNSGTINARDAETGKLNNAIYISATNSFTSGITLEEGTDIVGNIINNATDKDLTINITGNTSIAADQINLGQTSNAMTVSGNDTELTLDLLGNGYTGVKFTGKLDMSSNKLNMLVDLGENQQADAIKLTTGSTAAIADINIDIRRYLANGTYTLVDTSQSGNAATFNGSASVSYYGEALSSLTNMTEEKIHFSGNPSATAALNNGNIELTVSDVSFLNHELTYTGPTEGVWDYSAENWNSYEKVFFADDSAVFNGTTDRSITVDAAGVAVADMTVENAGNWTFTGGTITGTKNISLTDTTGKLTKNGTGTLTFNNNATFSGGADVTGGTMAVGNNATFTGNAKLTGSKLNIANNGTLAGNINATSGSEVISAGTMQGAVAVDGSNFTVQSGGTVSGKVDIVNNGTVTSAGTMEDAVTVNNSTFTVQQNGIVEQNITVTNGGILTSAGILKSNTNVTSGTFDLTGGTVNGSITLIDSDLNVKSAGQLSGKVSLVGHSNMEITQGGIVKLSDILKDSLSWNGSVTAGYGLIYNGGGTLNIDKDVNVFTRISNGTLIGTSKLLAGLELGSGAVLTGNLTVDDGVIFQGGSTFYVKANVGTDMNNILTVTSGEVRIDPQAILKLELDGVSQIGYTFKIIAAGESQFAENNSEFTEDFSHTDPSFFSITGSWGTKYIQEIKLDGYYLTVRASSTNFADALYGVGTPNAIRAALGVDELTRQLEAAGQLDLLQNNEMYQALISGSVTDVQSAATKFAQMHGEVFAAGQTAAAEAQRRFQKLMPTGREWLSPGNMKVLNRWGTYTGGWEKHESIGQYSGYELSSHGLALGIDRVIYSNFLIGAALGYDHTSVNFDSIQSKSDFDALRTMVYAGWFNGSAFIDLYGGYTKNSFETQRTLSAQGLTATAQSKYRSDMGTTGMTFGRMVRLGDSVLTPSIGLHYIRLKNPNAVESGADFADLHITGENYQSLRMPLGLKLSRSFTGQKGVVWSPEVRLFYVREWGDDTANVTTAFDSFRSVVFDADGGQYGRNSGTAGLGVKAQLSHWLNFGVDYDREFYENHSSDLLSATLGLMF